MPRAGHADFDEYLTSRTTRVGMIVFAAFWIVGIALTVWAVTSG